MAFDLEKEEAKYREERASRFTNSAAKQETVVDENCDKASQNTNESVEQKFKETFMWSAFFGGPIISYIAHLSEIRRSGKSYFWVVFGICIIPRMVVKGIDRVIEHAVGKLTINPNYVDNAYYVYCALEALMLIAFNLFMAFVAARRFGKICPCCNIDDYNQMEKRGVIAGAILWLILCTLNFYSSMV